ncbi:hypothetical protein UFOVP1654_10 [uncultured Caudovirales phage]|uniref:Uncharacterized protein n=1 Tax=uncultured Caudovirales phage TaxID=2100421 RepID=A0A6J5PAW6_9CAUD|nr:hypothetical protein UFOVP878_17 [uncultured Caudovirales phage]CAB4180123.1 hypothetical protein UFOVP1044_7 [uncultured Caudovirales phage]CAB4222117.1 hypothetical protein UFOVP1654_10 [uncultured Caudovirales phage]
MLYIVTCRTPNCENENLGIEIMDPEPTVICGACGIEITDKVQVNPEPVAKAKK